MLLSTPITRHPRASKCPTASEPINPLDPVTSTVFIAFLVSGGKADGKANQNAGRVNPPLASNCGVHCSALGCAGAKITEHRLRREKIKLAEATSKIAIPPGSGTLDAASSKRASV